MAWNLDPKGKLVWSGPGPAPYVPPQNQKALKKAILAGGSQEFDPNTQQQGVVSVKPGAKPVPISSVPEGVLNASSAVAGGNADPKTQSIFDAFRTIDQSIFGDFDPNASLSRDFISQLYGQIDPGKSGDLDRMLGNLGKNFTLNQFLSDANLSGLSKRSLQDYLQVASDLTQQNLSGKQLALPKPKQHGGNFFSDFLLGGATGGFGGSLLPGILPNGPFTDTAQKWAASPTGRAITDTVLSLLAAWGTGGLTGTGLSGAIGKVGAGLGVLGGLSGHGLVEAGQNAGILSFPQTGGVSAVTPGAPSPIGPGGGEGGSAEGGGIGVNPSFASLGAPTPVQQIPNVNIPNVGPSTTTLDGILRMIGGGTPLPSAPGVSAPPPAPSYLPGINFGGHIAYPTGTMKTGLTNQPAAPSATGSSTPASPLFSGGGSSK